MGVNKVILLGNLGRDPELRMTTSQTPVCSFSLATGERRKDQSGNWVDHTEWHNIITFGKTAENCSQFLKKGSQAFIEGKIQTRKWQDKEGKDRYTTEIIAFTVQFVGAKRDGARAGGAAQSLGDSVAIEETSPPANVAAVFDSLKPADAVAAGSAGSGSAPSVNFDDDDIPF